MFAPVVQRVARAFVPPLVAFALMLGAFACAARYSHTPLFKYDTWIKFDSGHYLTIANSGYEFMSCAEVPGYDPSFWCGNSGWFPGYPFLLRALHQFSGQPTIRLAILASQAFAFIDLCVVWNLFLRRNHLVVLALCAFSPGSYYFLVGFPVSLAVCFILISIWAQREDRPVLALLAGALAGLTYPPAIWLVLVSASELLVRRLRGTRATPGTWVAAAGPAIGFGAVLFIQQAAVGHWNAFFLTQDKYGHGLYNPFAVLWSRTLVIWERVPTWWQIGCQSLLATALVLSVATATTASARRRDDERDDLLLRVYGVVFWLLPLVLGRVSPYRAEALLMPVTTSAVRFSTMVQAALLGAAVVIWLLMATQFVRGALV